MNDDFRRAHAQQLSYQDRQLADLRRYFNNLDVDEQAHFRAYLKKVQDLENEVQLDLYQTVCISLEECDDEGNVVYEGQIEFSAPTILEALKAWDKDEPFTPDSVWP